jgi:hypothetical protein
MAKFKSFVIKHSSQKQTSHQWTQIDKYKTFPTRTMEFQIVHQSIQHPIQSHEEHRYQKPYMANKLPLGQSSVIQLCAVITNIMFANQ